jgi:multicomponent Na+:H+ antiporter subunit G
MSAVTMTLLAIAWFFIIFGVIAIFSFKNMYLRIMASATIDTVASFILLIGLMFISPTAGFIIRFVLLIFFLMITSPISTHVNIRSAYLSKIPLDPSKKE